jgi:MFS-type transporter involved in bile tolerance (Atg22 family)
MPPLIGLHNVCAGSAILPDRNADRACHFRTCARLVRVQFDTHTLRGFGIGLFVGPVQAASRSLMARLAPDDRRAAYFGLFALSGRATAFLGPALVALATSVSGIQRLGLATIIGLFAIGLILLLPVREPRGKRRAAAPA